MPVIEVIDVVGQEMQGRGRVSRIMWAWRFHVAMRREGIVCNRKIRLTTQFTIEYDVKDTIP